MTYWNGVKVIVSESALENGAPCTMKRSFRQRWLSWPWRPWIASVTYTPKVPAAFYMPKEDAFVVHPRLYWHMQEFSRLNAATPDQYRRFQ